MPARRGSSASTPDEHEESARDPLANVGAVKAGPLFIWAALQVLAIGLAASRVSLAAQYPLIGEFHASQLLLAVQLPLAAMLMPVLLTNWRSTLSAAFLAVFLQLIAFLLTDVSPAQAIFVVIYVVLWIAAMALWRWSLGDVKSRLITTAGVLGALVSAGPLVAYLGAEFSSRDLDQILSGPVLPMLRNWPDVPRIAWAWLATLIVLALGNRLLFQGILLRATYQAT